MRILSRSLMSLVAGAVVICCGAFAPAPTIVPHVSPSHSEQLVQVERSESGASSRMLQWSLFERNISSLAACNSLMNKMKPAYGPNFRWDCESYLSSTCPPITRWALWFADASGTRAASKAVVPAEPAAHC